jgi:hypothetical protein
MTAYQRLHPPRSARLRAPRRYAGSGNTTARILRPVPDGPSNGHLGSEISARHPELEAAVSSFARGGTMLQLMGPVAVEDLGCLVTESVRGGTAQID